MSNEQTTQKPDSNVQNENTVHWALLTANFLDKNAQKWIYLPSTVVTAATFVFPTQRKKAKRKTCSIWLYYNLISSQSQSNAYRY